MLVNKKLNRRIVRRKISRAAPPYAKYQQHEASEPVRQLAVNAAAVTTPESLNRDQHVLVRMIDEIQLANMLEK